MKKYRKILLTSFFLLMSFSSKAEIKQGLSTGSEYANAIKGQAGNVVKGEIGSSYLPNFTSSAKEENHFKNGNGLINIDGYNKTVKCQAANNLTNEEKTECEAINLITKSSRSRPLYSLNPKNDEIIVRSESIDKQILDASIDSGLNNGKQCYEEEVNTNPVYEEKTCSIFSGKSYQTCSKKVELVNCKVEKSPVDSMKCGTNGSGVLHQSIRVISNPNGYNANIYFENQKLVLETIMGGSGNHYGEHIVSFELEIKNLQDLDEFLMLDFISDDSTQLIINNHNVWHNKWNFGGNNWSGYSYGTANLNLKPFLKEGKNEVIVKNFNHRGDWHSKISIQTRIVCNRVNCEKRTVDTCKPFNDPRQKLCRETGSICKKNENGICFEEEKEYVCEEKKDLSDCKLEIEQGCKQISSICTNKDELGNCTSYSQKYQCLKQPSQKEKRTICVETSCTSGECIEKQKKKDDQDFAQAVTMMEVAREAGIYGEKSKQGFVMFKGEENSCTVKRFAGHNIFSCCKFEKIDAEQARNSVTGKITTNAYGNDPDTPMQPLTMDSTYQYDDIYENDKLMRQMQAALTGGWLSCKDTEKKLAVKRGSSLCNYATTYCSKKRRFIGCIENTNKYCCFKSILAKLINRQGREQLGLSTATCEGLTIEQIQKLDFSKIDLTEFKQSIVPANIDMKKSMNRIQHSVEKQKDYSRGYYAD